MNVTGSKRKGALYIYNSTCTRSVPANDEKSTSAASLIYAQQPLFRERAAQVNLMRYHEAQSTLQVVYIGSLKC